MTHVAGIDIGSRTVKVAVVAMEDGAVVATALADQGVRQGALAERVYGQALAEAGLEAGDIAHLVATGYGRNLLEWAQGAVTEITCHARGVRNLCPDARTIIDIGGQDSKVIHLDEGGAVVDFAMNDRCAAGTGRFLEIVAQRLETPFHALGDLTAMDAQPTPISSMCVVFAETEIVGLLASGAGEADILAGAQKAIATRVAALAGRRVADPVVFTGGVALTPGMGPAMEKALGRPVLVAPQSQLTGAIGAALIARDRRWNAG